MVMTLRAAGDAELLQAQRAFHLAAGVDAIVDPAEIATAETGWIIPAAPGEFWWPRGGSLREVLAAIPAEYDVVQALVRPFVTPEAAAGDLGERVTYRLSAQAMLDDPAGSPRPARHLAHRSGVDVSAYEGEIPKAALRPLRGWYPIEVLSVTDGQPVSQAAIDEGIANGTIQLDTRLRDVLRAVREGRDIDFPRPTVVENASFAVDAAVLGEADAFGIRHDIDALEHRLAVLEDNLGIRIQRKLRSLVRRGSRAT